MWKKDEFRSILIYRSCTLPRMWKKVSDTLCNFPRLRTTPTYVEKSLLLYIVSVLFLGLFPRIWEKATHIVKKSSDPQDHSHLRGKKYHEIFYNIFPKGTLPLAWEKVVPYPVYLACPRITPTRVGKSPPNSNYPELT